MDVFDSFYNIIYNNIDRAVCCIKYTRLRVDASTRLKWILLKVIQDDGLNTRNQIRYSVSLAGKYKLDMVILCILILFRTIYDVVKENLLFILHFFF